MHNPYGVGMPPQPGTTQIPLGPNGQPIYQQPQQAQPQPMPQQFAPQQFQQPTQPGKLSLGGDEILDGAGVPAELRGRKVADVMRIYQTLADDFITRRRQQTQNPQAQPQGQQPRNPQGQFQQLQSQPQQPQQQPQGQDFNWQNPNESIANVVRQVVQEAVQPFQNQSLAQGSRAALESARQKIPDWQQLEPDIMEAVKGSSPEALANPEYWEHAADLARGRRFRNQQPQQPQAPQPQGFPFNQGNPFNQGSVPATAPQFQQPMMPNMAPQLPGTPNWAGMFPQQQRPQTHQFFTEAPTAPSPYQGTHSGALTPAQQQVAQLAGISPEQYAAMAGIQQKFGG